MNPLEPNPSDPRDRFLADERRALLQRAPLAAVVMLTAYGAFAVGDWFLSPAAYRTLWAIKLAAAAMLTGMTLLLWTAPGRRFVGLLSVLGAYVGLGSILAQSNAIGDTAVVPTVATFGSLVLSAMLPWGVVHQAWLVAAVLVALIQNATTVSGGSVGYAVTAAGICSLASVPLTYYFSRVRFELWQTRAELEESNRSILRQHAELAELNANLEQRVDEQVAEIVRRAEEVGQLNAQLRSQVRARSNELSEALARLALQKESDSQLRPGSVLGDRFEIGETLGSGGMGIVFSAHDRTTGATVAIKVIRPTSLVEPDAMRRFVDEAGTVAAVSHPAVVRMFDVGISDTGLLYQAQEMIDGETLEQRLQAGRWPEPAAARLGEVLCSALAAAHAGGVVHRDVKPANVMLIRSEPGLKLLDFGLAKLYDRVSQGSQTRTGTGLVVGTPAYMAPEQVRAADATDKSDVYASGLVLFELVTGRHVFDVEGVSRIMKSHVATQAPDVRELRGEVSEEFALLIAECLAKDPASRPSAAEAAERLRTIADHGGALPLHEMFRQDTARSILRRFS